MQKFLIIVGAIVLGVLAGVLFQPLISGDNVYDQVKKFDFVLNTANKNYVEEVDTQKLVEAALKGMLNELDVHSVYITAESMRRVDEDFRGSFEGIGIEYDILNDTITVVSPLPGGPSERLGILSGDKIISIDGEDAIGLSRDDIPKKLKGRKGTIVNVEILRPGEEELIEFEITRDKISKNSVEAAFLINDTDVGLIRINRFANTTHSELRDSIKVLKRKGMKKLVLDLRGNPGGLLDQAFYVADEFIRTGDTVVYTKGRKESDNEYFIATGRGEFEKLPLIVLVDAGSASASEIVSGAVQDHDRGLVLGVTSYGKGLVQKQYKYHDGSAIRITVAKYYTPSGRCIQRPYKNKEEYRSFVGRLDMDEGENIEHTFEKIKKKYVEDGADVEIMNDYMIVTHNDDEEGGKVDSIPIYYTSGRRPVLGGGGITPDYIVKYDTLTKLSIQIRNKNIYILFVDNYMASNGKSLRGQYKSDFDSFMKNYNIDDKMLADFRKFAETKKIKWDEELYKTDKEYIKMMLKADIARSIWDRNKFLHIYYTDDKMVNKALTLFPEASKMARLD